MLLLHKGLFKSLQPINDVNRGRAVSKRTVKNAIGQRTKDTEKKARAESIVDPKGPVLVFVVLFLVSLKQARVVWEEGSQLRKYLHQVAHRKVCGIFS